MQKQIRILSTKKLLPNQKQFLLNAGFSVIEADFIGIQYKKPLLKNINENLIFTSANAVRSFLEYETADYKNCDCYCVGNKTKALLEQNGFNVAVVSENANNLADAMRKNHSKQKFTFLTGNLRLETLPISLKIGGIAFNEVQVYETVYLPKKITAILDGILFFSPSAVDSYRQQNQINGETCFCIGKTTAQSLENSTGKIVVANQPTIENTIIQTINHYKKA